jgi:CheY-like chemotaxis protein
MGDGVLVQEQIVAMEVDAHAQRALRVGDARHVIDVCMCQQDVTDREGVSLRVGQQLLDFIAGIDQDGFTSVLTAQNEPILEEWGHRASLNYHGVVILAIVDDLMFASKIKTTAGQLGVAVTFARSRDSALAEMRKSAPALVIFDLNSGRTDPLGTVAAMKSDPALAAIPTLGFVSHVRTDVIDAARQAGVGEIMARSAFTAQLPDILTRQSG